MPSEGGSLVPPLAWERRGEDVKRDWGRRGVRADQSVESSEVHGSKVGGRDANKVVKTEYAKSAPGREARGGGAGGRRGEPVDWRRI